MGNREEQSFISGHYKTLLFGTAVFAGLYLASIYSYLLFHSLAELFTIVVALGIFVVTWNSRRFIDNNYLLFIGIAFLAVGALDLAHTLAYKGMGVFQGYDANLPTQLWIAQRYLLAVSFLTAPFFVARRLNTTRTLWAYALVASLLLFLIFSGKFPDCYFEGVGLTTFKKVSEYLISLIFLVSLVLLYRKRQAFDGTVFRLISLSLLTSVASELPFTQYASVYGIANLFGHFIAIISFYFIYKAIIETGIARPYDLVFRSLKQSEEALRESEERYRSLVELSPETIAVHREGRYVYVNPAGLKLFGGSSPDDIIGKKVLDLVHPDYRESVRERIRLVEQGLQVPMKESRIFRLDGRTVDIEAKATPITFMGKPAVQVVIIDITERKQVEEERQKLLAQLDQRLTEIEKGRLDLEGANRLLQVNTEELKKHRDHLEELVGERTAELKNINEELEQEIAERKQVEERLKRSYRQLRDLSIHLQAVREEERTTIAREVHDELGQALTALKMDISWLTEKLRDNALFSKKGRSMLRLIDSTIQAVKKISSELRPGVLDDLGLTAAIEWQAGEFQERTGIVCDVTFEPQEVLVDKDRSTAIFRIFQEALTNVTRHAGATAVRVELKRQDDEIMLSVRDNGRGITNEELSRPQSFGLIGMRERVHSFGGKMKVSGEKGKGTAIEIHIPLASSMVIR